MCHAMSVKICETTMPPVIPDLSARCRSLTISGISQHIHFASCVLKAAAAKVPISGRAAARYSARAAENTISSAVARIEIGIPDSRAKSSV
jgi:hypothetical protein